MSALLGWLAALFVVVLLIGVPLVLGRLLADRDRALEHDERSALDAQALALMVGQPVVEVSPDEVDDAASPDESASDDSPPDESPTADGQGSSPM